MSKMDGLRAMREAKYAEAAKRAAQARREAGAKAARRPARGPRPTASRGRPRSRAAEAPTEQLCGHRNMSGRSCTREHGHAAKSHRYS